MAREAHCSVVSAGRAVGLAAKLEAMPVVAAALAEGKISVDHSRRLGVAHTGHRAPAFTVAEETLVAIAIEEPDFEEDEEESDEDEDPEEESDDPEESFFESEPFGVSEPPAAAAFFFP